MDERTNAADAPVVAPASAGVPDGPIPAPMAAAIDAPDVVTASGQGPRGRGFPGFPAGDPDQLPLSQRPRGLDAAPPPGGRDPDVRTTLARERPYVRLLVGMVAVIVGGSLLLTFLALLSAAFLR